MARTFQKSPSAFEPGKTLQTIRSLAGKMRSWIKSGHTRHVRANGKGVGSSQKVASVRSRESAQLFPVAGCCRPDFTNFARFSRQNCDSFLQTPRTDFSGSRRNPEALA